MENKSFLFIPQKMSLKKELIQGFGKEELIQGLIIFTIIGIFGIIFYLLSKDVNTFIIILMTGAIGSIMVTAKDNNNVSVINYIGYVIRFEKRPKKYNYVYLKEKEYTFISEKE